MNSILPEITLSIALLPISTSFSLSRGILLSSKRLKQTPWNHWSTKKLRIASMTTVPDSQSVKKKWDDFSDRCVCMKSNESFSISHECSREHSLASDEVDFVKINVSPVDNLIFLSDTRRLCANGPFPPP